MDSAYADKTIENKTEFATRPHSGATQQPKPLSITHRHLLSCIKTCIESERHNRGVIRILDVGCGDGILMKYLTEALLWSHGHLSIEIYGMDVHDHGVQPTGYWQETQNFLSRSVPTVDWQTRLFLVSVTDPWPFADGFFDVVVSNQVLEHVGNHNYFFSQHKRVMKEQGAGFHLFPLWHCILEPHLRVPLVHWISNRERRERAIVLATKIGFGKYTGRPSDLPDYASYNAAYLTEQVNYKTQKQITKSAREVGLHPSFAKSHHYYTQKLRAIFGKPYAESYAVEDTIIGRLLALLLRYVSSSTLEVRSHHPSKNSDRRAK